MIIIALCLVVPYFVLLAMLTAGAFAAQQKKVAPYKNAEPISIIIAARNEEENIESAVNSLLAQDYPSHSYEIIVVDDHSEDATLSKISAYPQVRVICLPDGVSGKKAALRVGVSFAKFPYIAVTDADCTAPASWLKTLAAILTEKKPSLIVGPVELSSSNSFLSTFQQWEFRALQMVTFGSAFNHTPTLCNGANLCFLKEEYTRANLKESQTPSGDDIFLLHHLLKQNKKVEFCLTKDLLVTTKPETTLSAMLHQKLRWASKSKNITNIATIGIGIITFIINLAAVCSILYSTTGKGYLPTALIWGFKVSAEAILVFIPGKKVYGAWPKIHSYIIVALLMPFYATFVASASLFLKFTWKKRTQR